MNDERRSVDLAQLTLRPPQLDGHVDDLIKLQVSGWAHDRANPDRRLTVELLCDGEVLAQATADSYRADLANSGMGDGCCAFRVPLPLAVLCKPAPSLSVRVAGQQRPLPGQPLSLQRDPDSGFLVGLDTQTSRPDGASLLLQAVQFDPRQGLLVLARTLGGAELLQDLRIELSGQPVEGLRVLPVAEDSEADTATLWALLLPASGMHLSSKATSDLLKDADRPLTVRLVRGDEDTLLAEWPVEAQTPASFFASVARLQADQVLAPAFYLAWYPDLGALTASQARDHFVRHGFLEGRYPTMAAVLAADDLDLADLPSDFDWRCYVSVNPDLANNGVVNEPRAQHHYLSKGLKEGRAIGVAVDFYAEYHLGMPAMPGLDARDELDADDLAQLEEAHQARRAKVVAHWLDTGLDQGLAPSFKALLVAENVGAHGQLTEEDELGIRQASPQRSGRDHWIYLRRVLSQEPPLIEPIFGDDLERSIRFFVELATHYERTGNDARAREVFLGVLKLGESEFALEHLGNIAIRQHRWAEAIAYLDRARALGSSSPWVYLNLLNCHGALQRFDEVLKLSCEMVQRHAGSSDLEERHLTAIHDLWRNADQRLQALAALDQRAELCAQTESVAAAMVDALALLVRRGDDTPVAPWLRRQRVLIVGDRFITQCVRYRIAQKIEQGTAAGLDMHSIDWMQAGSADALAQTVLADVVIFYRTPGLPDVLRLMTTARLLGKTTFFEIDDLLFSQDYPQSLASYTGAVSPSEYVGLVRGMSMYRVAAAQCDFGIASTAPLQEQLAGLVRSGHCYLHRNALDKLSPMVKAVDKLPGDEGVVLFYGSGTKAHKLEFMSELLPALLSLLQTYPQLTVRLMGHFDLPAAVRQAVGDRLEIVPFSSEVEIYYAQLAAADIALSILHDDEINDAKSEIKWIEAACFEVPMVVSPTRNFLDLGADGELMLMARGSAQWSRQIARLIEDPALRRALGTRSQQHVLQHYGVQQLGGQLVDMLDDALARKQMAAQQQESRA